MTVGTDLRQKISGLVLEPGDDGFEQASRPWNLAVDQPVRAVVEAAGADDVVALVRYARRNGLPVSMKELGRCFNPIRYWVRIMPRISGASCRSKRSGLCCSRFSKTAFAVIRKIST